MLLKNEIEELLSELDYNIDDTNNRLDYVMNLLERHPKVLDMYLEHCEDDTNTQLAELFEELDTYVYGNSAEY